MSSDGSEHLGELLSAYLDGETGDDEALIVARHLAGCDSCRLDCQALGSVRRHVRGLPVLDLPTSLVAGDRLPASPPASGRRGRLVAAGAAAVAAVVVGVTVTTAPRPTAVTPQELSAPFAARASAEVGLASMKVPREARTP